MKNKEVCELFVNGDNQAKTKNLFIENDVLYSYGYHYPLAVRLKDGFILNPDGYSNTTSQHIGHFVRAVTNLSNLKELEKAKKQGEYKHIIFMTTEKIKRILADIQFKGLTIQDIQDNEIIKNL
jgi:hypothetical protein